MGITRRKKRMMDRLRLRRSMRVIGSRTVKSVCACGLDHVRLRA